MTQASLAAPQPRGAAGLAPLAKLTSDFDFLDGEFDVINRRLPNPLAKSQEWEEFPAAATARTYFNGAISVDEMRFPTKGIFGMSIRLFDPLAREWTVYWVDSRTGALQAPVRGGWVDGTSLLFGDDEHDGVPVRASYQWSQVTDRTAHWEQAFSIDKGRTWETNWTMDWSRRYEEAEVVPLPKPTDAFDFLVGRWRVAHRALSKPLSGSEDWSEYAGTAVARAYFNGGVSMDEFHFPTRGTRGLTVRLFDPSAKRWSIYWVSSGDGKLQPPVRGGFDGGVGEFYGDDTYHGRPIRVRYVWSGISQRTARWEQAFSADAGTTWETNWVMELSRIGRVPTT